MRVSLEYLEVENFKSFKGKVIVGPMKQFMCVIGPNGSGKSNFMDAISFVMGENKSHLRVTRLRDLIHGAPVGKPSAKSASVTAVFIMNDSSHKRFTRSILGSTSQYEVDRTSVTSTEYLRQLIEIGINTKASNFLVFQGTVEAIALKSPRERTELLEEISRSVELREEYETRRASMYKAGKDVLVAVKSRKNVTATKKEALTEISVAEKYKQLREILNEKELELQLFRLFYNQRDFENIELESEEKQIKSQKLRDSKVRGDAVLKSLKEQGRKLSMEEEKIKEEIQNLEKKINTVSSALFKTQLNITNIKRKIGNAKLSLDKAKEADNAHEEIILTLKENLEALETKRLQYDQSQSQGIDLQQEEAHLEEYYSLLTDIGRRSASLQQSIILLDIEQKVDQDKLDYELCKVETLDEKLRINNKKKDELEKRKQHIMDQESNIKKAREEKEDRHKELSKEVECGEKQTVLLQNQLEIVQEQLSRVKVKKSECDRREKKHAVVQALQSQFRGVFDRLVNICSPIHKKYEVAVTKVMGKYLDAIVVDGEATAKQCISYLKCQALGRETFLPLDTLQAKRLKDNMRNIQDPPNVHLLYDVLDFPLEIKRAVLFATNEALVCVTTEDANRVAYEIMKPQRCNAVSLDGTYFQKSGIISGGFPSLQEKASQTWHKNVLQLKEERDKLLKEIRSISTVTRLVTEMDPLKSHLAVLDSQLRYLKHDHEKTVKQLSDLNTLLEELKNQKEAVEPEIKNLTLKMKDRKKKILKLKVDIEAIEDKVFQQFCSRVGVQNIRVYEDQVIRYEQDRKKQRLIFEDERSRIQNQLDYETTRNTNGNILRWEKVLLDYETDLKQEQDIYSQQEQKKRELENNLKERKDQLAEKVKEFNTNDGALKESQALQNEIVKDIQVTTKQLLQLGGKLEQCKITRHHLFDQIKLKSINIPLPNLCSSESGESSNTPSGGGSISTENTDQRHYRESRVTINYAALNEKYKNCQNSAEIEQVEYELQMAMDKINEEIITMENPNLNAEEKLNLADQQLNDTTNQIKKLRAVATEAKKKFERVKKKRYDCFMKCFESVSNEIDKIYKTITGCQSGIAMLTAENAEEPYLEGISYCCIVPGKPCQPMQNLSGGEKAVAAIALLMALRCYNPSPFLVLDEIDAALDNHNIGKVATFFEKESSTLQTIVISLKEEFYSHADALVGICPEVGKCLESKNFVLDLSGYK